MCIRKKDNLSVLCKRVAEVEDISESAGLTGPSSRQTEEVDKETGMESETGNRQLETSNTYFILQDVNEPATPKGKSVTKKLIKITYAQEEINQQDKVIKIHMEQNRRKMNKILSLMILLNCLKQRPLINDVQANLLQPTNVTANYILEEQSTVTLHVEVIGWLFLWLLICLLWFYFEILLFP